MDDILYVSDLDGTLCNNKAELSENTVMILNRLIQRGLLFTYATARSYSSAKKITHPLHLKLPVATYNGAFLVNHDNGCILKPYTMNRTKIENVLKEIATSKRYPLIYSLIDGEERVSWIQGKENQGIKNYLKSRQGDKRLRPVTDYETLFMGDLFYITFIGRKEEIYAGKNLAKDNPYIYHHIQEDTYNKGEYWMEIYRSDATKEHAVQRLKRYAGVNKVVCFGDNINDMPMFQVSDRCYAVANANGGLKKMATDIIQSNEEDGVATWLERQFTS